MTDIDYGRRGLLRASGVTVLSASAVAILAGCEKMAVAQGSTAANAAGDVQILNVALSLEHEAISAYQLGAMSGLLQKPVLDVAVAFQSHHKEHRDALIATIRKIGGAPVAAKSDAEVGAALNAASLRNQTDVLRLAQRLEQRRGQRLYRRHPVLRRSRPRPGFVAARRRRDHALDGAVAGAESRSAGQGVELRRLMRLPSLAAARCSPCLGERRGGGRRGARPELYEIALRRLPFARRQPGRPGASRRLWPQGRLGAVFRLLERGEGFGRGVGGEVPRRLAHQSAGAHPRPAHELPHRIARGSRRHHCLPAPAVGQ